jgi:hypothetical protein
VTVLAGKTTATFTVRTTKAGSGLTATIKATLAGLSSTALLTIL